MAINSTGDYFIHMDTPEELTTTATTATTWAQYPWTNDQPYVIWPDPGTTAVTTTTLRPVMPEQYEIERIETDENGIVHVHFKFITPMPLNTIEMGLVNGAIIAIKGRVLGLLEQASQAEWEKDD